MTDDDLIERAIKTYTRHTYTLTKTGDLTLNDQPCSSRSHVMRFMGGTFVILANVGGQLAKYKYHEGSARLRRHS